nr:hypothetical protein [Neoroseomonas marina]
MHEHEAHPMGEEPDGGQRERDVLERVATPSPQQQAGTDARKAACQDRLLRMHVLQRILLVARQERRKLLVLRGGVEDPPVHVAREAGEIVPQPAIVMRAGKTCALRPGDVHRTKAGRALLAILRRDGWILDIGEGNPRPCRRGNGRAPTPERILRHAGTAGRAGPVERHPGERLGLTRPVGIAEAIADDKQRLAPLPQARRYPQRADGRAAGGEGMTCDKELGTTLRHRDVERLIGWQFLGHHLPHRRIREERALGPEGHETEHRRAEPELAHELERPREESQGHGLHDAHQGRSRAVVMA